MLHASIGYLLMTPSSEKIQTPAAETPTSPSSCNHSIDQWPSARCYKTKVSNAGITKPGLHSCTYRPLGNISNLLPHKLLQFIRTFCIRRVLVVVSSTIVEDQHSIFDEILWCWIHVLLMFFLHGRQIHWLLDHFVIIRNLVTIDRLRKRPGCTMVLHIVQQM